MKKVKIFFYIFCILILLFISACNSHKSPAISDPMPPIKTSQVYSPLEANNYFSFDLYNEYKSEKSNVFFSPFSIYTAMAMVYEGARGRTAEEIQSVFYYQPDNNTRRNEFYQLISIINKPEKKYKLVTSNNLWMEKTWPFLQEYLDIVTQYYLARLTLLDFVNDTEGSRIKINNCVESETEGRIKDLMPAGSIGPTTCLVLTNAIYFKASWQYEFNKDLTYDEDFRITPDSIIKTPMMHQRIQSVIENYYDTARVLQLFYENNEISMLIFLPDEGKMDQLEANMTAGKFNSWMKARTSGQLPYEIDLTLPKFKFNTDYKMTDTLIKMGMPLAFTDYADFSGISPGGGLKISGVFHKAFVEVNEEGTEAAAATGIGMIGFTSVGYTPPPIPVFKVDRPFIFMICENSTGAILFMGRVNEPKQE